ncbi:2,3,4,5-tetrahydropyridine-2,6-dicarboxylate N-succinyltransferase [bacterium]|nr:2,3,4,5-tetrahydropyridine-2,6-dicarboxylate N-succinyltransferase [bacterium]
MTHWYGSGFRRMHKNTLLDVPFVAMDTQPVDGIVLNSTVDSGYHTYEPITLRMDTLNDPIQTIDEAYFKLQLLSRRLIKPNTLNLDGLFSVLPVIAWTSLGPMLPEHVSQQRQLAWANGRELTVTHNDKFPYMLNYYTPSGVRIASGSQVRLGAYLAEGTTVMPAGFVNFNAGSLGPCMIEGRVSAGVTLGSNTDIGGGASIMGTLSGGNSHVIRIGSGCLLGANSGIGISLGDYCTVEAGTYITAGKKVLFNGKVIKARQLSGQDNLLFLHNSETGQLICQTKKNTVALNDALHHND